MLSQHISKRISSHMSFLPTADQQALLDSLGAFLVEPNDEALFVLNGYAGTGKTTVVAALVHALQEFGRQVVLLAPTGRAAKVMSSYSGHAAYTIHKKIYRQAAMRDGVGKFSLNINQHSNAVFLVDEASMISNSAAEQSIFGSGRLLDDLVTFVRTGKGCRLVLVGDSAQLPPVGLAVSPALDAKSLSFYGKNEHAFLREVVRQAEDSGILCNATHIRERIEAGGQGFPRLQLGSFPDVHRLPGAELVDTLTTAYSKLGVDNVVVITRSNKQANRYNAGIRAAALGKEEEIVQGDRLMVVKNSYSWTEQDAALSKEVDFIANGDIVELQRIRRYREMYGFRFAEATVVLTDYNNAELDCLLMLDTISMESAALNAEQSKQLFAKVQEDYAHITPASKRYAAIKSDPFFSALQVKHAYAVTCHKAQGGQWKAVFVDHGYLADEMVNVEFLRWLYTAFTRATEQLYLVNFDKRFFE
ncbi:MAG: AAA family ATPase [Prevotellaceae bacterium]|jgi:exodeoxyribonuclease-5|nr:AAA family ATPase [Prevotellaceae bacterium]